MKTIHHLLLISCICTGILLESCKKKKEDPTPAPAQTQNQGTSPTTSASLNFNGRKIVLVPDTSVSSSSTGNAYFQEAKSGDSISIDVSFINRPAKDTSFNLATSTDIVISLSAMQDMWSPTAGILNVSVKQHYIITSFTNVTFTGSDGTETLSVSGTISTKY